MKFRIRFDLRSLALVALLAASLFVVAGCGGDDDKSSNSSDTNTFQPTEGTSDKAIEEAAKNGELSEEAAKKIEEQNYSEEPPPIQILTGSETGYRVSEPTVIVVQSKKELAALKKKHFSNGVKRQEIAPIGVGDDRQLVALIMPQDKAGALVAINDVHEENGKIVVGAVRLLPGKGCTDLGPKVRPIHWVETREMKGEPELELETQRSSPCKN